MQFYYASDGTRFISKIEAIAYSKLCNKQISLYYHDEVYTKIDWKLEPTQSLDFYYKEQAQRIRDNFDYVILCYSGGYDSTNILETFYFNNIKLDKIVIVGAFDQDSKYGVDENHNGELYHNAFPYLKELNLDDITQVCDFTKTFTNLNSLSITKCGPYWIDHVGTWFSPHNWFWRDIENYVVPDNMKNKSVALVFGKDKPSLFPNSNNDLTEFMFGDPGVTSYGNYGGSENVKRINFYWDPTYPEILLKQLHVLKKTYQINKFFEIDRTNGTQKYKNYSVNDIVYNLRRPLVFKSPKSSSNVLSLRDFYLKDKTNSDVYDFYIQGIRKLSNVVKLKELPVIRSRVYSLV